MSHFTKFDGFFEESASLVFAEAESFCYLYPMNASQRFSRALDKLTGKGLDVAVEAVRSAFDQAAGDIPEDVREAVFLRFLDRWSRSGKPEGAFAEAARCLEPYIDLFRMDYSGDSAQAHPLSTEDWKFLRDEVSASADSFDLDILTYIMKQIMENGGFEG